MLRRRVLALLPVALVLLAGAVASPASASSPTAPLTAVQNADGSQSLEWKLQGTSDSINILPHLRCGADPTAGGVFAGSSIPCIWIVDHKAPFSEAPAGCTPTGNDYASWRCDMRLYRDITVDAAESGESSLVMFNTKPDGGSGICAWIPLAVRLHGGTGTIQAADGCRQRIVCDASYDGKVNADALDVVTGCRSTNRTSSVTAPVGTGSTAEGSGDSGSSGTGGSGLDLSKCTGAQSGKKGNSPLYSIFIKARGKRGMVVYVAMRRAVPITLEVREKTRTGSRVVRTKLRCARAGTNIITIPNATGGGRSRRNYGVIVRSDNSTYPLRSSYEALPRR
ncbi:hypothetical protein [Patulibacter minatonensis]|uniref:hypothetical protein n=1 Tax=Patulibacter minatonensis TaxID=298163 RepID=UPI00047E5762|nr:hypothetical protein [Patulibacter minatonensis]